MKKYVVKTIRDREFHYRGEDGRVWSGGDPEEPREDWETDGPVLMSLKEAVAIRDEANRHFDKGFQVAVYAYKPAVLKRVYSRSKKDSSSSKKSVQSKNRLPKSWQF